METNVLNECFKLITQYFDFETHKNGYAGIHYNIVSFKKKFFQISERVDQFHQFHVPNTLIIVLI